MRASDYPLPDYAVSCWHRGDALAIALPSHTEDETPRTLFIPLDKLPLDAPGWRAFINLLAERRRTYQANERPVFATAAEPTEVQLQDMMKAHWAKRARDVSIEDDIFTEATTEEETGNADH
jgi:hypothetical protein